MRVAKVNGIVIGIVVYSTCRIDPIQRMIFGKWSRGARQGLSGLSDDYQYLYPC